MLPRAAACGLALVASIACAPPASSDGAAASSDGAAASSPSPLRGKPAPDFSRPDLDGARFVLSGARGRVAVVKFIAAHCAPCKRTLPAIEQLHRDHPDIVVVGVSEDDTEDDARALASLYKLTFPVVHDSGSVLAGRYRVTELPVTFVVDRTGTVAWVGGPEKSERDLVGAALGVP
jgi:peroxiredoxin